VDIDTLMKQAQAILNGDNIANAFVNGIGKTPFSKASGTAQINDGIINNQDLIVTTPLVNVVGVGTTNLVNEQINYQLTLQRSKSSTAEALDSKDIKNTLVPVKINGTFAEPNVSLDVKAMVMNTQKAKIDEQKEALKKKITEKINEKLKGPAGERLKSLF